MAKGVYYEFTERLSKPYLVFKLSFKTFQVSFIFYHHQCKKTI